jgi:hypothetical protein
MKPRGILVFIDYHSVLLSELGPPTPSPASECVSLIGSKGGEQHSLAGERGDGGSQLGRLDRKPGTLYTLWDEVKRWRGDVDWGWGGGGGGHV